MVVTFTLSTPAPPRPQAGIEHGGAAGLAAEGAAFATAASLPTHKALVHIFFAQRATKKVRGVTDVKGEHLPRGGGRGGGRGQGHDGAGGSVGLRIVGREGPVR